MYSKKCPAAAVAADCLPWCNMRGDVPYGCRVQNVGHIAVQNVHCAQCMALLQQDRLISIGPSLVTHMLRCTILTAAVVAGTMFNIFLLIAGGRRHC